MNNKTLNTLDIIKKNYYISTMDLYKTLGVNRNASEAEIKKAYKKTSRETSSDKGGDSVRHPKIK